MKIRIEETGEIKELVAIDRLTGLEWTQDLIGNTSASLGWNEEFEVHEMPEYEYNWWEQYIADTEATEEEAAELADKLGITVGEVMEAIADNLSSDYDLHRQEAIEAMELLEGRK